MEDIVIERTVAQALGVPVSYFFEGQFEIDDLTQLLLHEFHALPTTKDKQAAIKAVRLILDTVKRHTLLSDI